MITLACGDLATLIEEDNFLPLVAIVLGCSTGMVAIIGGTAATIVRSKAREQTKRELAAYVAEGSLDPDKAVAILNAGLSRWERAKGDRL